MAGIKERLSRYFGSITIEPAIFLYMLGSVFVNGAALNSNLLIQKVCLQEFNYNATICDHLELEENEYFENNVQTRVNNFQMNAQWIGSVPTLVYSLFAGGLSDEVGRKPLLLLPLFGSALSSCLDILNVVFFDSLPMEFFYVEQLMSYFGGTSVYYLGFYGYGTTVSTPKERTARLARFDGLEQGGALVGTLLSPVLFGWIGYEGCYGLRIVLHIIAFLYVLMVAKEPLKNKGTIFKRTVETPEGPKQLSVLQCIGKGLWNIFIQPVIGMLTAVFRSRGKRLRMIVLIQLFIYGVYWFIYEEEALMYLYNLKVIPGYDGTIHSYYQTLTRIVSVFCLLVVMPIVSLRLQLHEGLILTGISFLITLGNLLTAFSVNLWQLLASQALVSVRICQYSTLRSQITKCIEPDEVGKIFSFIALIAALMPVFSNPAFRQLYNSTLNTFPAAFLLLATYLSFLFLCLHFFLYTQRRFMLVDRRGQMIT